MFLVFWYDSVDVLIWGGPSRVRHFLKRDVGMGQLLASSAKSVQDALVENH